MEHDRYMITRKVAVDKLPDTVNKRVKVIQGPAKIERSAAEVHEAYLAKIEEFRRSKREEMEAKIRAANQENMIRNFVKKPTMTSSKPSSNDVVDDN